MECREKIKAIHEKYRAEAKTLRGENKEERKEWRAGNKDDRETMKDARKDAKDSAQERMKMKIAELLNKFTTQQLETIYTKLEQMMNNGSIPSTDRRRAVFQLIYEVLKEKLGK
jgi:hypothetical protein